MLTITPINDRRIDMEMQGKIDADEMRAGLDELIQASNDIKFGKMLCKVINFKFPSFGAIMVELSRLPALLKLTRTFGRVAVVADEEWVRKMSEKEGKLYPEMEMRVFTIDQETEANVWLEGGFEGDFPEQPEQDKF